MAETAKERIENEIKSVDKRLHRGRNYGKTYNTGVKEGLMIARAHIIDFLTTDKLSVEKLQEQLNTAKYFFKNILDVNPNLHGGNSVMHLKNCVRVMKNSAEKALAAIGGDDE